MRIICALFALYVLYLSIYPCQDSETCVDERIAGIEIADSSDHNHNSAEQDLCTPFCICSCCAAHINLNHESDLTFVSLIHNTKLITPYQEKTSYGNAEVIWQPPKFS